MNRHLEARGWHGGCRPAGWILDRTRECAWAGVSSAGDVRIDLSGSRG
ncbi:hypothetical protein [Actinoplanes sp. NPDC020271]